LTVPGVPQRSDVVAMLATYGDRQPEQVPEAIDSLELAWLLHQIEQRYGVLDVDDDMIARMSTVTGAVDVLKDLRVGSSHD
jgi:acyl carrier protein